MDGFRIRGESAYGLTTPTPDGWMDGWMDGWIDGWMDGWVDGWVDGWMGLAYISD